MPIKSKAQRRKFAELLVKGEISPETFEKWNRGAGGAELPERLHPKVAGKPKRTTKPKRKAKARKVALRRKVKPKRKVAPKRAAKAKKMARARKGSRSRKQA